MNSRIRFCTATVLLLLIFGVLLFTSLAQTQEPVQTFSATVNRDCAPWDGSAFTVKLPLNHGDFIDISIWQAPDIRFAKTFSFPDNTGQFGNAILIHPIGLPELLTGTVTFARVDQSNPVEGELDLMSETGIHFTRKFKAEWNDQMILCG